MLPRRDPDKPNLTVEQCERCGRSIPQVDAHVVHGTHDDNDIVCSGCVTEVELAQHRVSGRGS